MNSTNKIKNDLIEDLNSSPPDISEEMFNFNNEKNKPVMISEQMDIISNNSNRKEGIKTHKFIKKEEENDLWAENQKLLEKIKILEKKTLDLELYCQNIETKCKEENPIIMQIKEKVSFF